MVGSLTRTLAAGALLWGATAAAQDSGGPPPTPSPTPAPVAAPVAATAYSDWPPDSLPTTPMPGDPSRQVRVVGMTQQSGSQGGLRVNAGNAWPPWAEKGYVPLRLTVENLAEKERDLEIELSVDGAGWQRLTRSLSLKARERQTLELALPAFTAYSPDYKLSIRDGLSLGPPLVSLGAPSWAGTAQRNVLLVGPTLPAPGRVDEATERTPDVLWSAATWEDLPKGPDALAAWTSLDVVVLDLRGEPPPEELLAPILAWTRLGGTLVVWLDGDAPAALRPWLEERFSRARGSYAMGLGLISVIDADPMEQPSLIKLRAEEAAIRSFVPSHYGAGSASALGVPVVAEDELPVGTVALLLLGLATLLGPVNLGVVWSMKRPPLLLASTPLLAVASSALLISFGLLRNGLDLRSKTLSITLLDQRSGRASTAELRSLYAGSAVGGGLRPAAGTVVLPLDLEGTAGWQIAGEEARQLLGPRFLPTREEVGLAVLSDRASSRSLQVQQDADGVQVTNQLGATATALVLRAADGSWWGGDSVGDGLVHRLTELDQERAAGVITHIGEVVFPAGIPGEGLLSDEALPPGTYLAELDGLPFQDDLGLAATENLGQSFVVGVLEGE